MADNDAIDAKKKTFIFYYDAYAAHLVEIFSVSIQSRNQSLIKDGKASCEIYGRIRVVDKLGVTFDIFNRNKDQTESIEGEGEGDLLLTAPSDPQVAVILASDHVTLDLLLFERAYGDVPVFEGEIILNRSTTSSDWEEDHRVKIIVKGNHGFSAKVGYAIFPYAVVANVSVLFFHKDDPFDSLEGNDVAESEHDSLEGNDDAEFEQYDDWEYESSDEQDVIEYEKDQCSIMANVFGTVTASTGGSSKCSVLFRKPIDGCVKMKSGGFIELSRSVLAVPAYSSLQIEASFSDHDTMLPIASGIVEFKPRDSGTYKDDIVSENGRIRVRVTWSDAYKQLNQEKRRQMVLLKQQPSATLCGRSIKNLNWFTWPMLEVFSVVVFREDIEPFRFHGKITVQDGREHCIFDKSESCPQDCPTSGALAIVGNGSCGCLLAINETAITLWLEDDSGATISLGHIIWRPSYASKDKFYDKRTCSIVRGDRGFAAVHYSMFSSALSAALDVKLYSRSLPGRIKGKLYARYGNFDYSRSYDEKYFQSILFYNENDGVRLDSSGSTLPLAKSFVPAPETTHIIIVADLSLSPIDANLPQDAVSLKGSVEIWDDGASSWRIGNDDLYIDVFVKLSERQ